MLTRLSKTYLDVLRTTGVGYPFTIIELAVAPQGVMFMRCDMGGVYAVNMHDNAELVCLMKKSNSSANGLVLSSKGDLYVNSVETHEILVFIDAVNQIKNKQPAQTFSVRTPSSANLVLTPDEKRLISSGEDLSIWNIDNGKLSLQESLAFDGINSIAVSPGGEIAVMSEVRHTLLILREDAGSYQCTSMHLTKDYGASRHLAYDAQGLLYVGFGKAMLLYDSKTKKSNTINLENGLHHFSLKNDYCYISNNERNIEIRQMSTGLVKVNNPDTCQMTRAFTPHGDEVYFAKWQTLHAKTIQAKASELKPQLKLSMRPALEDPVSKHAEYIVKNYYLKPFADGSPRRTHGPMHACRVAILGVILINLWQRRDSYLVKDINDKYFKLIQIAMLFHDAGRRAEGVDYWDLDSALLAYEYILTLTKDVCDATLVADAIANKDMYETPWMLIGREWRKNNLPIVFARQAHHVITHDADCLDNKRTKRAWHDSFMDYAKIFLLDEIYDEPCAARSDLMCVLNEVDILLYYTGDAINFRNERIREQYNTRVDCYEMLLAKMQDLKLSSLIALYANGCVLSADKAKSLVLTMPVVMQQSFYFKKFISTRSDYDLSDLILSFTRSPLNVNRRELRCERESSDGFSIRAQHDKQANTLKYAVHAIGSEAAKPMYTPEQKRNHSKATALSYCDPRYGYMSAIYQYEANDEIGFIFPPECVLVNRLLCYSGKMSTYYRFYEFDYEPQAISTLNSLQAKKWIFNSLGELVREGRNDKANQVLGRIEYIDGIKVCLFAADSEKAKYNAEFAAMLLQIRIVEWRKENNLPYMGQIDIPVIYYMPGHALHLTTYQKTGFIRQNQSVLSTLSEKLFLCKSLHEMHVKAAHDELKGVIESGHPLDPVDHQQRTPLFYAAQNGRVNAMYFLIAAGADVMRADAKNNLFIDVLYQFCFFAAFRQLIDKLKDSNPDKYSNVHSLLFASPARAAVWKKEVKRCVSDKVLLEWYEDGFSHTLPLNK